MKTALLTAGVCGVALVVAIAAQGQRFQSGDPVSPLAAALDANRDGLISGAEVRSAPSALKALDANGDGQLAPDELRPAFGAGAPRGRGGRGAEPERGGGPGGASADDLAETLMAFDRNDDGTLDRGEVPERFQGLFDRADANKDARLTREELRQSASATVQQGAAGGRRGEGREFGRGRGRRFGEPLLRALDGDRDGTLSAAEIAGAADALKTLDADLDGQLSAGEFRQLPPRGREGRR